MLHSRHHATLDETYLTKRVSWPRAPLVVPVEPCMRCHMRRRIQQNAPSFRYRAESAAQELLDHAGPMQPSYKHRCRGVVDMPRNKEPAYLARVKYSWDVFVNSSRRGKPIQLHIRRCVNTDPACAVPNPMVASTMAYGGIPRAHGLGRMQLQTAQPRHRDSDFF